MCAHFVGRTFLYIGGTYEKKNIGNRFAFIGRLPFPLIPFAVLASAGVILVVGLAADKVRILLFKALGVPKLCRKAEKSIRRLWMHVVDAAANRE